MLETNTTSANNQPQTPAARQRLTSKVFPARRERHRRRKIFRQLFNGRFLKGTYMSASEDSRTQARRLGYQNIWQHPREIGPLEPRQVLVLDLNQVLFDDKLEAIQAALATAQAQIPVGIHTFYLDDPDLDPVRQNSHVVLAKTHRDTITEICRRFP